MTLEIQILAWDTHKKVAELNRFIGFQPSSSHLMYSLLPPKGFNCHFTETRSWDTLLFHIFLGNRKQCFSGHHN